MNNELPSTGNIKANDQWVVSSEVPLPRPAQLKQEIELIQADIKKSEDAEASERNKQHWLKKRLKVAKDELTELSNA